MFFCQNNQWAISEPLERQSRIPLYQRARGLRLPRRTRRRQRRPRRATPSTKAALERAREGGGPTFIEAFTYRMGAHTTSDDPTRYRIAAEVEAWKLKDPIDRMRAYLSDRQADARRSSTALDAEADELAAVCAPACLETAGPDAAERCSTTSTPTRTRCVDRAARPVRRT